MIPRSRRYALATLTAAALLAACAHRDDESPTSEARLSVPVGQLLSADDLSKTVKIRLLDPTAATTVDFDLARVGGKTAFANRAQLGGFGDVGSGSEYQGGVPGPFNTMIWLGVFARFGDAMGTLCDAPGESRATVPAYAYGADPTAALLEGKRDVFVHPRVAAQIAAACRFEGDEAARRSTAGALFDSVMGYGGSLAAERDAFARAFARDGSPFVAMAAKERVSNMFVALLANPHFLLAK